MVSQQLSPALSHIYHLYTHLPEKSYGMLFIHFALAQATVTQTTNKEMILRYLGTFLAAVTFNVTII